MKDKLMELLENCLNECNNTDRIKCQYNSSTRCSDERIAEAIIANAVGISDATKSAASLNYESEWEKSKEELEKAKCEIGLLRDELRCKTKSFMFYEGIKQTVEVIFGGEFYNV